jgi:hypothetical protein
MEMGLLVSVVAAVLAIFIIFRTAREIIKNMTALEADRRKAFRRFIVYGSTLAGILILIMVGATAWIAMEKETATELQMSTDKKYQESQTALNKVGGDMVVAKRRSTDAFIAAYQDAVKAANDAAAKAAGFDNEENRKTLGDKFEEQHKALNAAATAKLQALVDHVERWRPVADGLRDTMGSGVKMVDDALKKEDLSGATKGLAAIRETLDADVAKLKAALDAASAPPSPAKPAAAAPAAAPAAPAAAPAAPPAPPTPAKAPEPAKK